MRRVLLTVSFCLLALNVSSAQQLPILNGTAISLPHPSYSNEFKELCAYGKVSIEVVIGLNGSVEEASAIDGDPILYDAAVAAARKAKFKFNIDSSPIRHRGLVIYNFPIEKKCIDGGVVNKRAINIPAPDLRKIEHISKNPTVVEVRIVVDMITGKVKLARAISGYVMYFAICEESASKAKFSPSLIDGLPVDVKATLIYKFNPNGSIEY
ncbi:MAG TPA: energy transducer TonB [Pyrinomonadaceae bacterium]